MADLLSGLFAALADPTRRQVVERLVADASATATGLAAELPISRQGIAKHLAALEAAGLVSPERVGREVRFRLEPRAFDPATRWLGEVEQQWERRLGRLRDAVERP